MIIIRLMGGLGNQLQQYALYCKLNECNKDVRLDTSWFDEENQMRMLAPRKLEIDKFCGVNYIVCSDEDKTRMLGCLYNIKHELKYNIESVEFSIVDIIKHISCKVGNLIGISNNRYYKEYTMYDESLLNMDKVYLEGYFACEYYYKDIIPELRKMLVLPPKESGDVLEYKSLVDEIKTCNSISMHLRRGDYLDEINMQMFGNICTDEYYDSAIKYVLDKGDPRNFDLGTTSDIRTKIFIFSDDSEYANIFAANIMSKYSVETKVVDVNKGDESCYDIELMSFCKHNICANSTFSFWGARLNPSYEKIIIRPIKQRNNQEFDYDVMKKLWSGWVFVAPDGSIYE